MTAIAEHCLMLTASHQSGGQVHVRMGSASSGSWQAVSDQLHGHIHTDTILGTKPRRPSDISTCIRAAAWRLSSSALSADIGVPLGLCCMSMKSSKVTPGMCLQSNHSVLTAVQRLNVKSDQH